MGDSETSIEIENRRPRDRDPVIMAAAVDSNIEELRSWLGTEADSEPDYWRQLVIEACTRSGDGYERAKWLDSKHAWESDAQLVEILDNITTYNAIAVATKAWIAAHNILPQFEVGNEVRYHRAHTSSGKASGEADIGRIVEIKRDEARYLIVTPPSAGAWCVFYEHAYPLDPAAEAA